MCVLLHIPGIGCTHSYSYPVYAQNMRSYLQLTAWVGRLLHYVTFLWHLEKKEIVCGELPSFPISPFLPKLCDNLVL